MDKIKYKMQTHISDNMNEFSVPDRLFSGLTLTFLYSKGGGGGSSRPPKGFSLISFEKSVRNTKLCIIQL